MAIRYATPLSRSGVCSAPTFETSKAPKITGGCPMPLEHQSGLRCFFYGGFSVSLLGPRRRTTLVGLRQKRATPLGKGTGWMRPVPLPYRCIPRIITIDCRTQTTHQQHHSDRSNDSQHTYNPNRHRTINEQCNPLENAYTHTHTPHSHAIKYTQRNQGLEHASRTAAYHPDPQCSPPV